MKRKWLVAALVLSCFCQGCESGTHESASNSPGKDLSLSIRPQDHQADANEFDRIQEVVILDSKEAVQSSVKHAYAWLDFTYEGQSFLFCHAPNAEPTVGVSIIDVKGWVYEEFDQRWRPLMSAETFGVGLGELTFDEQSGIVRFRGKANNRLKDLDIITFNLKATTR